MNHDELNEQLADYLAGEMDVAARQEFEARLAGDSKLAAEVHSLRGALNQMQRLNFPVVESARAMAMHEAPPRRSNRGALIGYAAAASLAFAAGWLMRSPGTDSTSPTVPNVVAHHSALTGTPDSTAVRFAAAYSAQRGDSSFARSLGALAQIHRGDSN